MSASRKISADWVFPVSSPPVENGILIFDQKGKILDLLDPSKAENIPGAIEKFKGILCPGFVNTHCHLELSWLKGKIPEKTGLSEFVIAVQKAKRETVDEEIHQAVIDADRKMYESGIVAAGDISNTNISFRVKRSSNIHYHTFIEIYGSIPEMAEEKFIRAKALWDQLTREYLLPGSITPHATYSVSQPLFKLIRQHAETTHSILSIHHQETRDESLLFLNKTGWIVENMKKLGVDYSWFKPTGKPPLESIADGLPAGNRLLLVHNTFASPGEMDFALETFVNVHFSLCPNANLYIEDRLPDIPLLKSKTQKLTIGTDSLASNDDLSVWKEIKTINRAFPGIHIGELIEWGTLNGAKFLGIDNRFGSFEAGKTPGINLITNIPEDQAVFSSGSKVVRLA